MNSAMENNYTFKMRITLEYLLIIIFFISGLFPASMAAAGEDVPFDLQAKLFLTALTYDKNLTKKTDEKLKIGVVYFPAVSRSKEKAVHFARVLAGFEDKKVSGRSFRKVILAYRNSDDLRNRIAVEKIHALYISSGITPLIKEVTRVTRSKKILSFTSLTDYVIECGVSMAVGLESTKPKIYLNLSSSKAEGVDFNARFLRVVKIVGEDRRE